MDWNLKIDIDKPDVKGVNRALKHIASYLDIVDGKVKSVDRKMKSMGGRRGSLGGRPTGANRQSPSTTGVIAGVAGGLTIKALNALARSLTSVSNAAVKATTDFAEFQNNIVSISRISGIAENEVAAMSDRFLDLSTKFPVAATEFQKFAEIASRFGIGSADGVRAFAETFGLLQSIIGNVSEETVKSVARIANISGFPTEDIDKMANAVVLLGKNFATSEDQIIRTAERVAQDTGKFGLAADAILGYATALDAVGIKAEKGGSALLRIFNAIQDEALKGGRAFQQVAEAAGLTFDQFQALSVASPDKAFDKIVRSGVSSRKVLRALQLAGVRVDSTTGVLIKSSTEFAEAMDLANEGIKDNAELMSDSERQADTLESKISRLGNTVSAAFTKIGETSDSELNESFDMFIDMASAFVGLDEDLAKIYPEMDKLGKATKEFFKNAVRGAKDFAENAGPTIEFLSDIIGFSSDVIGGARVASTVFANVVYGDDADYEGLSREEAWKKLMGIPEDGKVEVDVEVGVNIVDDIPSINNLFTAGDLNVKEEDLSVDAFEEFAKKTQEAEKKNTQLYKLQRRIAEDLVEKTNDYADKVEDIKFENSLRGLTEQEKRLKRLNREFEKMRNQAERAGLNFFEDEEFAKFIEEFNKVEKELRVSLLLENVEGLTNELEGVEAKLFNIRDKELARQRELEANPPELKAITDVASALDFIKESNRADKEEAFRRKQLAQQKEELKIQADILKATIERDKDEIVELR